MQKVIIIGAGPAGLTAADKLLDEKEKYDVTILEETFEIGGISRTVKYTQSPCRAERWVLWIGWILTEMAKLMQQKSI